MSSSRIVQVTNIAPQATREHMSTLFGYLGKIEDIQLFPSDESMVPLQPKVCYVKYVDPVCVGLAQHLTNTVFIDRALIVVPYVDSSAIPDEEKGLALAAGLIPQPTPAMPSNLVNQVQTLGGSQVITTVDHRLTALGLPQYPPLPANMDPSKIEEIRRTVYVGNLDSAITAEQLLNFFNQVGEVKYVRMAGDDMQPTRFAFVEFTDQSSVAAALQYNGVIFGGRPLKVNHSNNAIVKPQAKSNEAAQREIEEAMKRVREAQSLITAAIEPELVDKRRSRSHSRSRSRRRSRSTSRRRSRSRHRSRSKKRSRSRSRRSRSRKRSRSKSRRSPKRSRSREKRSRSRSRRKDDRRRSKSPRKRSRSRSKDHASRHKSLRRSRSISPVRKGSKSPGKSANSKSSHSKDKTKGKDKEREKEKEKKSSSKESTSSGDVKSKKETSGVKSEAAEHEVKVKHEPEVKVKHESEVKVKHEPEVKVKHEPEETETKSRASDNESLDKCTEEKVKTRSPTSRKKSRSPRKKSRSRSRSRSVKRKSSRSPTSRRVRSPRSPRKKSSRSSPPARRRSRSSSRRRASRSPQPKRRASRSPRRKSRSPKKRSKSRSRSASPKRSLSRHKKERRRSRDRAGGGGGGSEKKTKERERERDRKKRHRDRDGSEKNGEKGSSKDVKITRDYDEEEKGYNSGEEVLKALASEGADGSDSDRSNDGSQLLQDADDVTARFRNIRSVFQRELKKQQESRKTVGDNAEELYIPKWALFSHCLFLSPPGYDVVAHPCLKVEVNSSNAEGSDVSNTSELVPFEPIAVYAEESTSTSGCEMETTSLPQCKTRRKRKNDHRCDAIEIMSKCCRKVEDLTSAMSSTSTSRDILGFCTMLGARLELLPKHKRAALQLEFHQRLVEVEMEAYLD